MLECQKFLQDFPQKYDISDKILGFEIPKKFLHKEILEVLTFKTKKSSHLLDHSSHTFIRNFEDKAKILVFSDFSVFDNLKNNLSVKNLKSKNKQISKFIQGRFQLNKYALWENIFKFLFKKKVFPNILIVGLHPEIPQKIVQEMKIFIHKVDYLETLSYEQINLFDMIILNPMKLCSNLSEKNFCANEFDDLIHFRNESIFKSIFIVTEINQMSSNLRNNSFSSFYGLSSFQDDYFFSENFKFNKFFIEKFLSVLASVPIEVNIMYDDHIIRGNCLNHDFSYPSIDNFEDIDDFFNYFQMVDFSQYELRSLINEVQTVNKDVVKCLHNFSSFTTFLNYNK
jgi:hypothetical protein